MKKSQVRHAVSFSNFIVELLKGQPSDKVFAVKKLRKSKHECALENKKAQAGEALGLLCEDYGIGTVVTVFYDSIALTD